MLYNFKTQNKKENTDTIKYGFTNWEESLKIPRTFLFDKNHKDFHRMNIKKNAWNTTAQELEVEDGAVVENLFGGLWQRCFPVNFAKFL